MIKKVLLGLSVVFLGFIGFSNSARIVVNEPFVYNNNYFYTDNAGNLSFSQEIDYDRYNLLYSKANYQNVESQTAFFWHNNKIYYMLVSGNSISQIGYSDRVCIDSFTGGTCFYCRSSDYGDCIGGDSSSYYNVSSSSFYNNSKYDGLLTDIIVELRVSNFYGDSIICFRYESLGESVCFSNGYYNKGGLTSDNIFQDTTFLGMSDIVRYKNLFGYSPFKLANTPGIQSPLVGTYIYKNCSVNVATINFENTYGYNIGYCSGGNVVDGYYQYNTLKEYCSLIDTYLNTDYGDIPYTGHNPNACLNVDNSWKTQSGEIVSSIDLTFGNGNINSSGDYVEQNPQSFLVNLMDILHGKFYVPGDQGLGFLPRYIVWGLLFVILFRFLSH